MYGFSEDRTCGRGKSIFVMVVFAIVLSVFR